MEQWGMDVARFSHDRELRNQLSYNPTRLKLTTTGVTPAFVSDLYQQVWMLLEPVPSNAFENLDQYIMRDAFERFSARDPKDKKIRVPLEYDSMNQYWVDKVLGAGAGNSVADFLDDPAQWPSPAILQSASLDLTSENLARQLTGMVGRAVILLRMATGATRDLMIGAGCSTDSVHFWLNDMLTLHGIRVPAGTPRSFIDLYDGISALIDELGLIDDEDDPAEMAVVAEELAEQLHILSGFERVAAWAVA
ncbi:hypothetical protein [Rathayibacter tritici]|uniref:hypothetical protein n=1 Tax=Rathayibacter tritici TaxID=33888 RepID=UPI0012F82D66|nr:hypothetical protein [Rathayibacter tritici]